MQMFVLEMRLTSLIGCEGTLFDSHQNQVNDATRDGNKLQSLASRRF